MIIGSRAHIFKACLKGLIFGGAYIRWEIWVTKSIGLAYSGKANKRIILSVSVLFWLCCTLYSRAISKNKPPWGLPIFKGAIILMEGFCPGGELPYKTDGDARQKF